MNKRVTRVFVFFILLLNFKILHGNENKILVTVDSEPITSYELKNKILTQLILSNQEINQKKIDEFKSSAINFLINLKIKKNEIEKNKIEIDENNFNQTLKNLSNNDVFLFKKKFNDNSIDYDLFLEEIKIELGWQKLIYSLFRDNVKIDDSEVKAELDQIKLEEKDTVEYQLLEIELDVKDDDFVMENKKIKLVMSDIQSIGFEASAKKHSISSTAVNNGDLGWINASLLSNQIIEELKTLEINQISKPIKRLDTILILKIKDKRKLQFNGKNLDQVKKQIINQKTNELFKLYSNSHLSKLKNNSFIKFR